MNAVFYLFQFICNASTKTTILFSVFFSSLNNVDSVPTNTHTQMHNKNSSLSYVVPYVISLY